MNLEINTLELNETVQETFGSAAAECEIVLPDYCPNILRILSAQAFPSICAESRRPDRITLEGNIDFRVMYLAENGTKIYTVTQQSSFTQSFELKEGNTAQVSYSVQPEQVTARALSPQRMHVKVVLRIPLRVTATSALCLPNPKEDCEYLTRNICYSKRCCEGTKPLRISDEFELGTLPAAVNILRTELCFLETEQKPLTEKLIVKADMCFRILYADSADVLHTAEQTIPVSQILDLTGLDEETICAIRFQPLSCSVTPKETIDGETKILAYDVEVNVRAEGYRTEQTSLITDAYSLKNKSECTVRQISFEQALRIREDGTAKESMEIGYYDSVYDVNVTPVILSTEADPESREVRTEGTWNCTALIRDANGDTVCVEKSIPFSICTKISDPVTQIRNECTLSVISLSFSPSDATHLEFRVDYRLNGMLFIVNPYCIVTDLCQKEERVSSQAEMVLYYAEKGESVWQIAKKYTCRYEKLRETNHIEGEVMEESEMLLILRG